MRIPDLTRQDAGLFILESVRITKRGDHLTGDLKLMLDLTDEADVELPDAVSHAAAALDDAADEDHGVATLIRRDPLTDATITLHTKGGTALILRSEGVIRRLSLHAVPKHPRAFYLVRVDLDPDRLPVLVRHLGQVVDVHSTGSKQGGLFEGGDGDGDGEATGEQDLPPEPQGEQPAKPKSRRRRGGAELPPAETLQ